MTPMLSLLLLLLLALLLPHAWAIRIETTPSHNASASVPVYRVSRPQPQQPAKRVPPHLQDIRPGYVDDDAGDVIRIIEPPQHFQQLKRQRQRQSPHLPHLPQSAVVWEQPRKLSTNRQPAAGADLLTQETQLQNSLQLPVEILASVRKTERLLQRQQQQQLPALRQRHIQRQTHTLIAQRSLAQQLQQRGQQQRLRAMLSQQQQQQHQQLQQHKRSKRVRRQASYDVAHGLKLVARIGELLKNATRYVPDDEPESVTESTQQRRRQRLFAKKTAARRGRNFRHEATTTTAKTTTTTTTTTSATPLASRLVNSRKSANNRNQLPASRSDDAVLYADVMSNIRNLWQQQDAAAAAATATAAAPSGNSSALNAYLSELADIAEKLPLSKPKQAALATPTPTPSWYVLNNETRPTSELFHLFPDTSLDLE